MKILAFLFTVLVTAVILAGACGMQPGGTPEVGKMQPSPNRSIPRTPSPSAHSSRWEPES